MNPVTLKTLITRVRQRVGMEGATKSVTDLEITDNLNVSLALHLYDLIRMAVQDNYYRKPYVVSMQPNVAQYDLPSDFLTLTSVDVWLVTPTQPGALTYRINARRYMEYERNYYQQILLGWSAGATALYSLTGNCITMQPTPTQAVTLQLNYVPTSPQIGGGPNTTQNLDPNGNPTQPNNYTDTWDDVNGWSEVAVLDSAAKVCLKLNRLDMVGILDQRRDALKHDIRSLIALRHAGEPERVQYPQQRSWGDGWEYP